MEMKHAKVDLNVGYVVVDGQTTVDLEQAVNGYSGETQHLQAMVELVEHGQVDHIQIVGTL